MSAGAARLPPPGLPGLDPAWSRVVTVRGADGVAVDWHVLDRPAARIGGPDAAEVTDGTEATQATEPRGTLLCVHGNPTWSYLWRRVLAAAPPGWRVLAPDQLGMGFSQRLPAPRTLAERIADLGALTDALDVRGPVVVLAHDWGGPVSLGWALEHRADLRGLVLTNTAVHQPAGSAAPSLIRLARLPGVREAVCVRTPVFVRAATAVSRPRPSRDVQAAYAVPYGSAARRRAVGDFVADIPLADDHPSAATLAGVRDGLASLADVPTLLLWGPRDPVFGDVHLRDLLGRLPQAQVHRYEGASHLVVEDAPRAAEDIARWVGDLDAARDPALPAAVDDPRKLAAALATASLRGSPEGVAAGSERVVAAAEGVAASEGEAAAAGGVAGAGVVVAAGSWRPLGAALTERAQIAPDAPAVVELAGAGRRVTAGALAARVQELAAGLADAGVRPGQRVALLVPPGADLAAAIYACWRLGAVVVVADAGLGLRSMGRALRGAAPDVVIGSGRGLVAAAAMRVPGRRVAAGPLPTGASRALGAELTLADLARRGRVLLAVRADADRPRPAGVDVAVGPPADRLADPALPPEPGPDAEAAVVFTSGATGPPKGVRYRHGQVRAQLDALAATYDLGPHDRLVAAFAPFALYGPALGIASAVPDVDVTAPGTLTAAGLAHAAESVDATVVFAAPAALRNVLATAAALTDEERDVLARIRLLVSAGAPVPAPLLQGLVDVLPKARMHTPYGMTEVLPVTDVSLETILDAGPGEGVCVGTPVEGVDIAVSPLGPDGRADGVLTTQEDLTGEICVRAAHVKDGYDRLWATERQASRTAGWHRTGDVGHLDARGQLWVEGRLVHVIATADAVVTPVGIEQRVEALDGVAAAAVVGVGPVGTQQVVVVIVPSGATAGSSATASGPLAEPILTAAVRAAAGVPVAAVLRTSQLPVDIRHQSKIDRTRVGRWAEAVLAGRRARRRP